MDFRQIKTFGGALTLQPPSSLNKRMQFWPIKQTEIAKSLVKSC